MILLSIDVGISNLAFCLYLVENNNIIILLWDIIDLINQNNFICSNEKCKYKAKYTKDNMYYCKTHAKSHNKYLLLDNELTSNLNKLKLKDLIELAKNYNIIKDNIKINKTDLLNKIDVFKKDMAFTNIEVKNFNLINAGKIINSSFKNIITNYNINCVLIENQMANKSSKMATIQGMLSQYFIDNNIFNIIHISSSNKLKLFIKKKLSYKEKKKIGIDITNSILIAHFNDWYTYFNNYKKKDDMADCFLQGFWYLLNNNLIDNNYLNNINY
jgi:hypothetical protein